jgi:hypothetical protein
LTSLSASLIDHGADPLFYRNFKNTQPGHLLDGKNRFETPEKPLLTGYSLSVGAIHLVDEAPEFFVCGATQNGLTCLIGCAHPACLDLTAFIKCQSQQGTDLRQLFLGQLHLVAELIHVEPVHLVLDGGGRHRIIRPAKILPLGSCRAPDIGCSLSKRRRYDTKADKRGY